MHTVTDVSHIVHRYNYKHIPALVAGGWRWWEMCHPHTNGFSVKAAEFCVPLLVEELYIFPDGV